MGHNVKFHCLNLPELTPSAGYITERNILRASGSFSWNDNTRYGSGLHYIQILLCVSLWHQLNLEATYDISQCHIVMTCYVAPYRYTDIQIYRCTDIQIYRYIDIQIYRYTDVQMYRYADIQMYRYADIQIYRYTDIHIYRYTDIQIYRYTCIQIYRYTYTHYTYIYIYTYVHVYIYT